MLFVFIIRIFKQILYKLMYFTAIWGPQNSKTSIQHQPLWQLNEKAINNYNLNSTQ